MAEEHLLASLEAAPSFRPAQKLLAATEDSNEGNEQMASIVQLDPDSAELKEAHRTLSIRGVTIFSPRSAGDRSDKRKCLDHDTHLAVCRGHCLITRLARHGEDVMVRTIAQTLGLCSKRIQFTPDLMPPTSLGHDIIREDPYDGPPALAFVPGPIFGNIVLADEINRTPPKTQSALLEAMQELFVPCARANH